MQNLDEQSQQSGQNPMPPNTASGSTAMMSGGLGSGLTTNTGGIMMEQVQQIVAQAIVAAMAGNNRQISPQSPMGTHNSGVTNIIE